MGGVRRGQAAPPATLRRFARYRHLDTRVCVDPENSVFYDYFPRDPRHRPLRVARRNIGQPRVEPSFVCDVIDRVERVPDAATVASLRFSSGRSGSAVQAAPPALNLWGGLTLAAEMLRAGEGSVVTLLCDPGDRYGHTYYDDRWVAAQGLNLAPYARTLDRFGDRPLGSSQRGRDARVGRDRRRAAGRRRRCQAPRGRPPTLRRASPLVVDGDGFFARQISRAEDRHLRSASAFATASRSSGFV